MTAFLERHLFTLLAVVVAGVLAWLTWGRLEERAAAGGGQEGGVTPVVVAETLAARFVDTLQAVGSGRAFESVDITANVSDRIAAIRFREGDLVEAGDLLVLLDTAEEEAELAEALADLDDQRRQFERLDRLVETNAAAQSLRDQQRARLEGAEARVRRIRARIEDRRIRAPFAGVLGLREVSPGALVSPGTRITTLDEVEPMKLDFSVPENFLPAVRIGAQVSATTSAFGDRRFEGVVRHVNPRVDPVTRSVAVRAELPNEERLLRPGMLMLVELVKERRTSLAVPEAALIPQGRRQFVYRIDGDAAERVEVTIGVRRPGLVEITSGLAAGESVVVEGAIRLRPGAPIAVERRVDTAELLERADSVAPVAAAEERRAPIAGGAGA